MRMTHSWRVVYMYVNGSITRKCVCYLRPNRCGVRCTCAMMHPHAPMYIYMYIRTYAHTYLCVISCIYTHTHTHTHTHIHLCVVSYVYIYTCAHVCACTYTHTCVSSYTHSHTHTQTCVWSMTWQPDFAVRVPWLVHVSRQCTYTHTHTPVNHKYIHTHTPVCDLWRGEWNLQHAPRQGLPYKLHIRFIFCILSSAIWSAIHSANWIFVFR